MNAIIKSSYFLLYSCKKCAKPFLKYSTKSLGKSIKLRIFAPKLLKENEQDSFFPDIPSAISNNGRG